MQSLSTVSSADKSGGSPPLSAQEATTFAIIYGYPLLPYSVLASKMEEKMGGFKTNAFYHQEQLANADFNAVIRPNVDTLYSEALVDLSSNDLIVNIPKVPSDRFYVFSAYDVYGNNVVNIGTTGASSTPGRYLLTYSPADPGYNSGDDTYTGYINLPTPYGVIINRIQVNGPDDVKEVKALQVQFTLTSVSNRATLAPKLTKSLLFDGFSTDRTEMLLQLTARLSVYNLPEIGSEIPRVNAILRLAGLSRGSYTTPSSVDLTKAMAGAAAAIASVSRDQFDKYFLKLGNGWSQMRDIYSGDFKNNYDVRAFIAEQAYLQLTADQSTYPAYNDVSGKLTSDKSYSVAFSRKPPVKGFWSLTVYDETGFLVANSWKIYALGDRSAIKYPDGSLVYPKSGSSNTDGEFSLLLQTLDTPPPEKYRSNWIPTTASGKSFNFLVRWYAPESGLQDGSYVYPKVTAFKPVTTV